MHDTAAAARDALATIPEALVRSRLYANGGFLVLRGLFDEATVCALSGEARAAQGGAARGTVSESDGTETRGGCPARDCRSAPGGPLHWGLYAGAGMTDALERTGNVRVRPTGAGTYSYYDRAGDFLGLHRDVDTCDLALVTCLTERATDDPAGTLVVYPQFRDQPLSLVQAAGRSAGTPVVLERGDTIALLGGITPHEVAPVQRERIVAIMCYRLEPPPA